MTEQAPEPIPEENKVAFGLVFSAEAEVIPGDPPTEDKEPAE